MEFVLEFQFLSEVHISVPYPTYCHRTLTSNSSSEVCKWKHKINLETSELKIEIFLGAGGKLAISLFLLVATMFATLYEPSATNYMLRRKYVARWSGDNKICAA